MYAALATLIAVFHCIIAGTLSGTGLMIIPPCTLKLPRIMSMSVSPDYPVEMYLSIRDRHVDASGDLFGDFVHLTNRRGCFIVVLYFLYLPALKSLAFHSTNVTR